MARHFTKSQPGGFPGYYWDSPDSIVTVDDATADLLAGHPDFREVPAAADDRKPAARKRTPIAESD